MRNKMSRLGFIVTFTSVIFIFILELIALSKGFNGGILRIAIFAIAFIGGGGAVLTVKPKGKNESVQKD